ncbi:MAG TPA: hypothetical protein PK033_06615 [Acetivibrio sp.]|nr:hypothetical protein [Clostridium sp.]HQA57535.1 hypothetical protein [Acetivibrio sp.]
MKKNIVCLVLLIIFSLSGCNLFVDKERNGEIDVQTTVEETPSIDTSNGADNTPGKDFSDKELSYSELTQIEKERYNEIKQSLETNKEWGFSFSGEKSEIGEIKYDFDQDGLIETISYKTNFQTNQYGVDLVKSVSLNYCNNSFDFEFENFNNYFYSPTPSNAAIVFYDVDKDDNFLEFNLVNSNKLSNRVKNTIFRINGEQIEKIVSIDSKIISVPGDGNIYYWSGNIFGRNNLDYTVVYYNINDRKFVVNDELIGKTLTAEYRFTVYLTKESVVHGAPVDPEYLSKKAKENYILEPGEKFTVTSLDGVINTWVGEDGINYIFYNDSGLKIRTESGVEGWIGGFHMVYD